MESSTLYSWDPDCENYTTDLAACIAVMDERGDCSENSKVYVFRSSLGWHGTDSAEPYFGEADGAVPVLIREITLADARMAVN